MLERVDVKYYFEDLLADNIDIINRSKVLIIDNSVFNRYLGEYQGTGRLILENKVREYYKPLILLADNIANVFRRLTSGIKDWKKLYEIKTKFKKK